MPHTCQSPDCTVPPFQVIGDLSATEEAALGVDIEHPIPIFFRNVGDFRIREIDYPSGIHKDVNRSAKGRFWCTWRRECTGFHPRHGRRITDSQEFKEEACLHDLPFKEIYGVGGFGQFDCVNVPSLLGDKPAKCLALPLVTLTSITMVITHSDSHHNSFNPLILGVGEGLKVCQDYREEAKCLRINKRRRGSRYHLAGD